MILRSWSDWLFETLELLWLLYILFTYAYSDAPHHMRLFPSLLCGYHKSAMEPHWVPGHQLFISSLTLGFCQQANGNIN